MTVSPTTNKHEYWFIFQNGRLLTLQDASGMTILTANVISDLKGFLQSPHLLIQDSQYTVYCAELAHDVALPDIIQATSFKLALESLSEEWYNIAAKAFSIITWDKNHQFCGHCSQATTHVSATFERVCSACALTFYPRISPSIIVLIHKNNQILMARGHHFLPGIYALIAGFIEPGETVEDAVHREVKEEVGIEIKNLQYFGSQSWPFPDSLMIAFTAEYAGGELILSQTEIEDAGWYDIHQLPGWPSSRISIARKLIEHYLAQHHPAK